MCQFVKFVEKMKRQLKILFGTFGVILAAVILYSIVSEKDLPLPLRRDKPSARPAGGETTPVPGVGDVAPVLGVVIYQYDKHHNLRAKYTAAKSEKVGDKLYLTDPKVQWYQSDGETIIIQAQRGIITASEAAGKWNIRRGLLRDKDKICITMDRNRDGDPDRPPLEQRPEDAVRIYVDKEVRFDNDLLTIEADGDVSVFSKEADIFGEGLRIAWSESPRRLRELRIVRGDRMVIREGQDRFIERMSLPGGVGPARDAATKPAGSASMPVATKPSVALAETPTSVPTTAPATAPSGSTGLAAGEPAPIMPDTYVVTFSDNVLVTSGDRRIEGADELRLVLEFKSPRRQERQERQERQSSSQPASPERRTSASAPAERTPASRPADVPIATTQPVQETVVIWTGPLVVKPFRSHEKPVPKRFDVSAIGKTLVLSEGKSQAVCESFQFHSPGRGGILIGTPDEPVKLTMAGGERITVPLVRFDSDTGYVNLDGPGQMYLPRSASAGLSVTRPAEKADGDEERQELTITWKKNVVASLGRRQIETPTGVKNEDFLREAVFIGDVDVRQGETQNMKAEELTVKFHRPVSDKEPVNRIASLHAVGNVNVNDTQSGEFIKSQVLDVQMSGMEEERTYPRKAVATGDVSARQEKREITAEKMLTITFTTERDEKTGKVRIKPMQLDAAGAVKIIDRSGNEPVLVEAETVTSDLSAKTAILEGKQATVRQKDNIIRGDKIFFNQVRESADVAGPGSLRFYSDSDISGNKVEQPRPVDIVWKEKMNYRGKDRTAIVTGEVHLETAGDELDCENMQVVFSPAPVPAAAAPTAESKPAEFASFRPRRIETVVAEKNVRLKSRREDKDGFLLQRVQLRSEHVIYEADRNVLTCPKAGTLSTEDYRPPEKKAPANRRRDNLAGNIDRPSQSAFRWSESMKMDQTIRTVWMSGKVRLVHRSGENVVLAEKLNVRPWGKLPAGRKTQLDCEQMQARFAAPESAPAGKADLAQSGPAVGPLDFFDATGDVNLEDGPRQVFCQRILYQRISDIANIWGSLPGEPVKNAIMYYRDAQRGVLDSWKSPKLIWHRKNNRVEAKDADVRGGR